MNRIIFLVLISGIFLISCEENETENMVEDDNTISKSEMTGAVQKGPFLNGTSIDIYELLNADLIPTGRSFSSQIMDNSGLFEINNLSLISSFIEIKANGFYYNEITGENSNAPITLYALADITDKNSVNVNILSHLAKSRIEYLIQDEGISFSEAHIQAKQEILNIFSMQKSDIADFDLLNISQEGKDNAILLAISIIAQGYRSESELSALLANINTDIRQDGELNSSSLGSSLINDARLFDLPAIREGLESWYNDLGISATIPDFETYINTFIDSTSYEITSSIVYPEFSNYGENILYDNKVNFGSNLSLAAELPNGNSLKIVIKGGRWYFEAFPNGPLNWTISSYDNEEQTFIATESGTNCDLNISFDPGTHIIEYYENGSESPTRIKTFTN